MLYANAQTEISTFSTFCEMFEIARFFAHSHSKCAKIAQRIFLQKSIWIK
jgi:hypothetical protein